MATILSLADIAFLMVHDIRSIPNPETQRRGWQIAARGHSIAVMGTEDPAPLLDWGGADVEILKCNLADRSAIESALVHIEDHLGPLEHLILGIGPLGRQAPLDATTRPDWAEVVVAPLTAAFHLCQAAMTRFTARKRGNVIFLLSDYAIVGLRDGAAFAASQAALYAFAKSIAREFVSAGIRVNCLGVGLIPDWQSAEIPIGRPAQPDDVAAVAAFLHSDRASYITGQLLQPNGGRVMW
jgi:3-oxoacyl-[acyl-carrier protein] reductase